MQRDLDILIAKQETEDINKRNNDIEQAKADFKLAEKKINDDINKQLEEQGKLIQQAGRELADARYAVTLMSQEERQRIEINRKIAEFIEKYAGVLSSEELHTAMAQFRADLEKANSAAFKFQQGLREVFDEAMNVAEAVGEVGVNAVETLVMHSLTSSPPARPTSVILPTLSSVIWLVSLRRKHCSKA